MMNKTFLRGCVGAYVLLPAMALAEGDHDHNHGRAEMVISIEDNIVAVDFTSDMWNLVGFERAPKTAEEKVAAAAAAVEKRNAAAAVAGTCLPGQEDLSKLRKR